MPTCPMSSRVARLLELEGDERLEIHLAGCPDCQRALDTAAGALLLPPASPAGEDPPPGLLDRLRELPHEPTPEEPPPSLPGFEVMEVIGRGGSAVVYKARQMALNRLVALKVLSPEYAAQPDGLARARRGVEALAAMDHPGIVRVLHAGMHEGVYYAVQEYVEGGSLARRLNGLPWPAADAARLVRGLADAVQALHERGFVHRDLKPANVLLGVGQAASLSSSGGARDKQGCLPYEPKIADFGLVRAIDDDKELTAQRPVVGTPGAMAPEQAGRTGRIGPAADVWALGVILYELLTGHPPFDAESTTELLGRTVHDIPEPPSRLAAKVPANLEHICLTCLRKDPRDRYASAAALADDLSRFLADQRLPSRPGTAYQRFDRWARKHPSLITVVLVQAFLLLVLFSAVVMAWRNAAERDEAQRTLHHLRLDMARDRLERGDRSGAWMMLERCPPERRDHEWERLWRRSQPAGE